jgi:hypothetical protein
MKTQRLTYTFDKPVVNVYRTNERKPCIVIRPERIQVIEEKEVEGEGKKIAYTGMVERFRVLEGDVKAVSPTSASTQMDYILCWEIKDQETGDRLWKKLVGVTFPKGLATSSPTFNAKDFLTKGLKPDAPPKQP